MQVLKIRPVAPAAGGIDIGAAGFFDFDDISTPVGELAHGGRARAVRGKVEYFEAVKRQWAGGHGGFLS